MEASNGQTVSASLQHPTRILLVEDNPGDAELVRTLIELSQIGPLEIEHCVRAADAIERLRDEDFQLIVLDLGLPDSHGLETLRRIQTAYHAAPIVVLTSQTGRELSRLAVRSGAQDCLCKDHISAELLARTILNVIERHEVMTTAVNRSMTDELTGLLNRRGFAYAANALLESSHRLGAVASLIYVDLDGLKTINDELGHAVGDLAIQEAAEVLRTTFRSSDVLSRLGGDEFAAFGLSATGDGMSAIRERLDERLRQVNSPPDRLYVLSLSVGGVEFDPMQAESLEALLHLADLRMYEEKQEKKLSLAFA